MVTKLFGVQHNVKNSAEVMNKLDEFGVKPGQTVALELEPDVLRLFGDIGKSKDQNWEALVKKFSDYVIKKLNNPKIQRVTDPVMEGYPSVVDEYLFYYNIFRKVNSAKGECKAIDSHFAIERVHSLIPDGTVHDFKKLLASDIKNLQLLMPVREAFLARKIIKTKPDYAIVGFSHVDAVHKLLKKQNYPSEIVFRQKVGLTEKLFTRASFFLRWAHKKRKAKNIKARQRKFARGK